MDIQKKLSKILVLADILISEIDDPVIVPNKETKLIQDKARELQELLIPVVDKFYKSKDASKTTFFNTMANKIEYIFQKEYK